MTTDESTPASDNAVVYPPDGTRPPFTVINLGHGKVKIGDCWHDDRLWGLWFGRDGQGIGTKIKENRHAEEGETLAVVTFANVEGLDVLLDELLRIRRTHFPEAGAPRDVCLANYGHPHDYSLRDDGKCVYCGRAEE